MTGVHPKTNRSDGVAAVRELVERLVREVPVVDIHTHLFDPAQGELLLFGIDEILTYHYHVAELFRARPDLEPEQFWAMPKAARADLVWSELFVERSPLSDVGRGVVYLLDAFGLDPAASDLREARAFFAGRAPGDLVDQVFQLAGVRKVFMTNDPLDPVERATWLAGFERDPRFAAALRLDSAIMEWPRPVAALRERGFAVSEDLSEATITELTRYLREWQPRMDARYMAVSLPPRLDYPAGTDTWMSILTRAVVPTAIQLGIPIALMIGVRRQVNPRLGLAGDSVGETDVESLENLARDFPEAKFLVTLLGRGGQHALCVAARKFANLTPFGCWWFMNNEGLVREITAMRLDLLGPTFVPQHSDSRVLEQMVFKWGRSRAWLGDVLAGHYADLYLAGGRVDENSVQRDLDQMLGGGLAPE